jgi:hypothetical protein
MSTVERTMPGAGIRPGVVFVFVVVTRSLPDLGSVKSIREGACKVSGSGSRRHRIDRGTPPREVEVRVWGAGARDGEPALMPTLVIAITISRLRPLKSPS